MKIIFSCSLVQNTGVQNELHCNHLQQWDPTFTHKPQLKWQSNDVIYKNSHQTHFTALSPVTYTYLYLYKYFNCVALVL